MMIFFQTFSCVCRRSWYPWWVSVGNRQTLLLWWWYQDRHRRRKGDREHTLRRLTHLRLRFLKWWRASLGCDPCSSDQSYSCLKTTERPLLHRASVPKNKVESQHSAPSPALSVDENTNSVLVKHYRYTGTSWPGDGGRVRKNWTLASAQHDSIKLGAQHDWIKLGRIPILRHKASKVPLHKMNLGWIWFLHWFHHGCLRVAVNSTCVTYRCIKMQMSSCNIWLYPTHHHKLTSSHFWLRLKNKTQE